MALATKLWEMAVARQFETISNRKQLVYDIFEVIILKLKTWCMKNNKRTKTSNNSRLTNLVTNLTMVKKQLPGALGDLRNNINRK